MLTAPGVFDQREDDGVVILLDATGYVGFPAANTARIVGSEVLDRQD